MTTIIKKKISYGKAHRTKDGKAVIQFLRISYGDDNKDYLQILDDNVLHTIPVGVINLALEDQLNMDIKDAQNHE